MVLIKKLLSLINIVFIFYFNIMHMTCDVYLMSNVIYEIRFMCVRLLCVNYNINTYSNFNLWNILSLGIERHWRLSITNYRNS